MASQDTRTPEEKGIDAMRARHAGESFGRSHYGAERRVWRVSDALDGFAARVAVADFAAKSGRNLNGTRAESADAPKASKASKASKAPTADTTPAPSV